MHQKVVYSRGENGEYKENLNMNQSVRAPNPVDVHVGTRVRLRRGPPAKTPPPARIRLRRASARVNEKSKSPLCRFLSYRR